MSRTDHIRHAHAFGRDYDPDQPDLVQCGSCREFEEPGEVHECSICTGKRCGHCMVNCPECGADVCTLCEEDHVCD